MQRVSCGHLAGHRAGGNAHYPVLSSPDAVRLVHHAVQSKSRLCQHVTLHPGGRLPAVSTDDGGAGGMKTWAEFIPQLKTTKAEQVKLFVACSWLLTHLRVNQKCNLLDVLFPQMILDVRSLS